MRKKDPSQKERIDKMEDYKILITVSYGATTYGKSSGISV